MANPALVEQLYCRRPLEAALGSSLRYSGSTKS
jgi:hypothetical protein